MVCCHLWAEAKRFLSEQIPLALDVCGPNDIATLKMRARYAQVLRSEKDYAGAVTILEDVVRRSRRVFGSDHPHTERFQGSLAEARRLLTLSNKNR